MKRLILPALLLLSLLVAVPVLAATVGDPAGVPETVPDDLYVAHRTLTLQATVNGDAIIAGGEVTVNGPVAQDLLAAGGTVTVNGPVEDDIRAAGGTVTLAGPVGSDVVAAGGKVVLTQSASASGDALLTGGEVQLLGRVRGNLRAGGGTVVVDGIVNGDAEITAEDVTVNGTVRGNAKIHAQRLTVGPQARFEKDLTYVSNQELQFGSGTVMGAVRYQARPDDPDARPGGAAGAFAGAFSVFHLLSTALIVLILLLLNRTFLPTAAERLRREPLWNAFYGLVYLVLTPAVSLLLMITLIGLPLGLALLAGYIFSLVFLPAVTAVVLAFTAERHVGRTWGTGIRLLVSIGMAIVLRLLWLIPIIGWAAWVCILLAALGAVLATKLERLQALR